MALTSAFFLLSVVLLVLIGVIDARIGRIPDALSIPFIVASALHGVLAASAPGIVLSAVLGGGFFLVQWIVSGGRWVGSGDILLGAGVGFLLMNWRLLAVSLIISYIVAAIIVGALLFLKKARRRSQIPFGPFLAFGTLVTVVWRVLVYMH